MSKRKPKRKRVSTTLTAEGQRRLAAARKYVRGFCGPTTVAETLRFLVLNWSNPDGK